MARVRAVSSRMPTQHRPWPWPDIWTGALAIVAVLPAIPAPPVLAPLSIGSVPGMMLYVGSVVLLVIAAIWSRHRQSVREVAAHDAREARAEARHKEQMAHSEAQTTRLSNFFEAQILAFNAVRESGPKDLELVAEIQASGSLAQGLPPETGVGLVRDVISPYGTGADPLVEATDGLRAIAANVPTTIQESHRAADGLRKIRLQALSGSIKVTGGPAKLRVLDKDGNVKEER